MNITEWLKNNGWSLLIASITFISTFTLYGYRIDQLEHQSNENKTSIALLNTQQVQLQVQLAQISTDISYIKVSLDRILK